MPSLESATAHSDNASKIAKKKCLDKKNCAWKSERIINENEIK